MNRFGIGSQGPVALVVDDDPTMRLMLQTTLKRGGIVSEAVVDGRSALAAFGTLRPDLVLLDIGLPDIDGFEVCRALRAQPGGRDTPVLMLTGHDDAASVERSYEVGATDFIAKPINWEILAHRVRYILRSARAFFEVARSRERLADAQRVAGIGSWEWNIASDKVECSEEALRILGQGGLEVPVSLDAFLASVPVADRQHLRGLLVQAARIGTSIDMEHPVLWRDGSQRVLHLCGRARESDPGVLVIHGTVQDITERRVAEERIRHLAYHDSLTGLPNRAWLHERIAQSLEQARCNRRSVAVMLLDIDQFKRINDTLGHSVGDQLLCAVAQRLGQQLRCGDAIARVQPDKDSVALSRLGGDEFCIVLDSVTSDSVTRLAERVLGCFVEPFALADHVAVVTPSIGVALYPHDATDAESLMRAADMAMYHTKNEGRNNYSFYRAPMNARALDRLTIESELRRALEREELVLHYQPIVSADTGTIVGLEALLRWQHPERGLVMPARFIEIAEEAGLIVPMGEWVLQQACEQSAVWQAQGLHPPPVAVNVSADQFRRATLLPAVRRVLETSRIPPGSLKLEITESVLMRDVEVTLHNLRRAKEMGVRLSIDDFGTGYSSLAYLKRFPADELKLDRSFVAEIVEDARNEAIASAVIQMARSLSLSVVAEGIENAPQAVLLRRLGCLWAQGYHFHRPQPVEAVTALLRAARPFLSLVSA